ncbi:MAG: histidine phosphatase family protein [Acidimicrobiia bacterium]|nr:histidine phosphatase family protein [Acidimicrobiia bacterium]
MADVIHLVRHGEVLNPSNICYADLPSFGLSDLGRRQARDIGTYLTGAPISGTYTSPLRRALETWSHTGIDMDPTPIEGLTEWGLSLRWKGHRWDELDEFFPGEVSAYSSRPTDLPFSPESIRAVADRMVGVVAEAHERHPSGHVVFVGHQDPIQAARLSLTARSLSQLHEDKPRHGSVITLSTFPDVSGRWIERSHWWPEQG